MNKILLLFFLLATATLHAQIIQEVCEGTLTNGTLVNATSFEGRHYVTGFFTQICGEQSNYIAEWDGDEWASTDWELTDSGHALRVIDDLLYIARYEESIDSNWLYVYDGTNVEKVGAGVYLSTASGFSNLPNIYDVVSYNDRLVICGEFDWAGNTEVNSIAQWVDGEWQPLGDGLQGNIANTAPLTFPHQMLVWEGDLYVAGNFGTAGGVVVNGLALWDGSVWSAMGDGFNSTVSGIGIYNDELYVGGDFTASGNTPLNRIAKWDGSNWVSPGFGFVGSSPNDYTFVHTIKEINDQLFVAGGLQQVVLADGTELDCGGVISFDGTNIVTHNGGVSDNDIEALLLADNELLVGGGVFGNGYAGRIDLTTDVESLIIPEELEVYPNPATDIINWKSKSLTALMNINIINAQGKYMASFSGNKIEDQMLDVSHLAAGYYCLLFAYADGRFVRQTFVKM